SLGLIESGPVADGRFVNKKDICSFAVAVAFSYQEEGMVALTFMRIFFFFLEASNGFLLIPLAQHVIPSRFFNLLNLTLPGAASGPPVALRCFKSPKRAAMRWRALLAVDRGRSFEGRDNMPCKQFLLFEGLPMRHAPVVGHDVEFGNPSLLLQPCNL